MDAGTPTGEFPVAGGRKPRRWRFQFRLRTLILVVALCCLPLSWLSVRLQRARTQRAVRLAIEQAGGGVVFDYDRPPPGHFRIHPRPPADLGRLGNWLGIDYFHRVDEIYLDDCDVTDELANRVSRLESVRLVWANRSQITDSGVRRLTRLRNLEIVHLDGNSISDAAAEALGASPSVRTLSVNDTQIGDAGLQRLCIPARLIGLRANGIPVTDEGLKEIGRLDQLWHLANIESLRELNLAGTSITDAGVAHLANLKALLHLNLAGTRITDAGPAHLVNLVSLERLDLSGTRITDATLGWLSRCRSLSLLDVQNTRVSENGLRWLETMLPSLTIRTSADPYGRAKRYVNGPSFIELGPNVPQGMPITPTQ